MTRTLFISAAILGAVWLVTFAVSSFLLDPENIGGRLGLYLLGILAFLAGAVVLVVALVKRARTRA